MNQPSHSYSMARNDEPRAWAIDRNPEGLRGSGEPPLPASRRALPLRGGGFTLAKQRDPESIRGFTLVELLIATGITVAMVFMLGLMLTSLMSSASQATQRVDAFRAARAAMQMIERDLRNLVRNQWSPDPFASPAPSPCRPSAVATNRVTLPAAYFVLKNIYSDPATGNQQLYALVADRTTGSSGDVCAVGYYCRWDDQLHAYTLRRFFRDSAATLAAMQGAGNYYVADSVLYDLNAPGAKNDVLAAYVWNFQVAIYDAAGTRYTTYPCVCDQAAATPNGSAPTMLPAAIEISFNAMSPQAARTVMSVSSSPNDWMDTTTQNYQRLIAPHAYQFRARINLP
jgi:type II secretory pathway pseudopilin PulG